MSVNPDAWMDFLITVFSENKVQLSGFFEVLTTSPTPEESKKKMSNHQDSNGLKLACKIQSGAIKSSLTIIEFIVQVIPNA